jgi:hypothetical protein
VAVQAEKIKALKTTGKGNKDPEEVAAVAVVRDTTQACRTNSMASSSTSGSSPIKKSSSRSVRTKPEAGAGARAGACGRSLKPEPELEPRLEPRPEPRLGPEPRLELEPELEAEAKPEVEVEPQPKPELELEPKPELDPEPEPDPKPMSELDGVKVQFSRTIGGASPIKRCLSRRPEAEAEAGSGSGSRAAWAETGRDAERQCIGGADVGAEPMSKFDEAAVCSWLGTVQGLTTAQLAAAREQMAEDEYEGAELVGCTAKMLRKLLRSTAAEEAVPRLIAARDAYLRQLGRSASFNPMRSSEIYPPSSPLLPVSLALPERGAQGAAQRAKSCNVEPTASTGWWPPLANSLVEPGSQRFPISSDPDGEKLRKVVLTKTISNQQHPLDSLDDDDDEPEPESEPEVEAEEPEEPEEPKPEEEDDNDDESNDDESDSLGDRPFEFCRSLSVGVSVATVETKLASLPSTILELEDDTKPPLRAVRATPMPI